MWQVPNKKQTFLLKLNLCSNMQKAFKIGIQKVILIVLVLVLVVAVIGLFSFDILKKSAPIVTNGDKSKQAPNDILFVNFVEPLIKDYASREKYYFHDLTGQNSRYDQNSKTLVVGTYSLQYLDFQERINDGSMGDPSYSFLKNNSGLYFFVKAEGDVALFKRMYGPFAIKEGKVEISKDGAVR